MNTTLQKDKEEICECFFHLFPKTNVFFNTFMFPFKNICDGCQIVAVFILLSTCKCICLRQSDCLFVTIYNLLLLFITEY